MDGFLSILGVVLNTVPFLADRIVSDYGTNIVNGKAEEIFEKGYSKFFKLSKSRGGGKNANV